MKTELSFKQQFEKFSVVIKGFSKNGRQAEVFLDYPVVMQDIKGTRKKLRYDRWVQCEDKWIAEINTTDHYQNRYRIEDIWLHDGEAYHLKRKVSCQMVSAATGNRLTSEFRCRDILADDFDDYQFVIPGALYNKNDTDGDGMDDYLGTFNQDYKDDRNPSLSVTAYLCRSNSAIALLRGDVPTKDKTITREQIKKRHFIHDTDIGSLGFSPSEHRTGEFILRCDYPFYERNSFCLNVDGSEWSAYKRVEAGTEFTAEYLLFFSEAQDLTEASWNTTLLQMGRILNPAVELPLTLTEARYYRRELVHNSFREFPEKKGCPAGYFIHFSPRQEYGEQNILEYGFCGQQTLLSLDMLAAARENRDQEYRRRALKTIDYFVTNGIAPSGLPNGIYNVDKEEYVYWMTGILLPFQYSDNRQELEQYLGGQVVGALIKIAGELEKSEGNYSRSMIDTMDYLMKCYLLELKDGYEHPEWLQAVVKFCDKLLRIQNENGSWNRGYTMSGEPLMSPPEWFGASERECGSGAIFPARLLTALYGHTGEQRYLSAASKAAYFVYHNYVKDAAYVGGINDTAYKKSIKADTTSVMFAMRTMLAVYEATDDVMLLNGARDAARILASWVYLWNIPFDQSTLLGRYGFCTTGWAVCDVIPAGSYVDCVLQEFVPELLRLAELCQDRDLAVLARIVTRGMQHGLATPQQMYGYAMTGVQCEGYMTSLWLADTDYKGFSGAAAKNKGDDNDTCNGFVNGQALWNLDQLDEVYGTLDFNEVFNLIFDEEERGIYGNNDS